MIPRGLRITVGLPKIAPAASSLSREHSLIYGCDALSFCLTTTRVLTLHVYLIMKIGVPRSDITHRLALSLCLSLDTLLCLPFIPQTAQQHMKQLTLVSHVSENDFQFTVISLLHRRLRQSGLIAEIDASCPRPPSKHSHSQPQSHFSMKQQLTANRCSWLRLVIAECGHEIEVTVAKGG